MIDLGGTPRTDFGGALEFFGQTPVYLNLVRLCGAGSLQVFYAVNAVTAPVSWGGGGHFGFELFLGRRMSLFLEVGGQGRGPRSGATVIAGLQIYPFS